MSNARFGLRVRNGLVRPITEGLSAIDSDVLAFITAAGITDNTQFNAINQLVIDLKTFGLWTKMKAIYPFVGGTAASHKWNLKDPRDLNSAFRLDFFGGWTHSSTGAKPNGTNAYANTYLFPNIDLLLNSSSHGFYSGTNTATLFAAAYGAVSNASTFASTALYPSFGNNASAGINDPGGAGILNTNTTGFFIASRTANNSTFLSIRNLITTQTTASTYRSLQNILLATETISNTNNPRSDTYSPWEHRFTFLGEGLSQAESTNLFNIVTTFQTTLGRQI